jgi:autotransporter-associated beta strand protein
VGNGGGLASSGAITVTGGTLNAGTGQIWIGQGSNGVGSLTISGGTFIADNWLAIGRASGTGTLNLSGGVLLDQGGGGNLDIGTSGGIAGVAGTGTFNQTGGVITNTASQTWLGEGTSGEAAAGTWNMSGGTAQLGEVHVGVGGTGSSTVNISGAAAVTCAGYVDISLASSANGTVNIGSASQPGGSLTANGDLTVGDIGTGVINMVTNGGGLLTVHGTIYLSRNSATAFGSINLNSGSTIVASYLNNGWGFGHGLTNNPQAFNFNGGTLQAYTGSAYFIQPYVNAVVQSGGAIINDGGFNITVLAALVDGGGGGGLTKLGNGTLIFDGANTYTGTTLVSAGTLALGATGSIAGPVTIASGATLAGDTGSIQNSYINNTLTLAAGSTTTMKITPASNDQFEGLTGVNYGGALVLTNISGSPLVLNSVFQLFHSAGPGSGNFSSITILPYGAGTFNPANGLLTITSVAQSAPVVNPPGYSGGDLILTGNGGTAGSGYTVLSSTNVAAPLAQWVTNTTGTFNGSGGFSNAIPVTNTPTMFFQVRVP